MSESLYKAEDFMGIAMTSGSLAKAAAVLNELHEERCEYKAWSIDSLCYEKYKQVKDENARLREALEFYRDGDNKRPWVAAVMSDGGRKARAAMEGK